MERRSFLRLGASAAVAAATSKVAWGQNNYQALLAGQYTGLIQFKPISAPGTWLGDGNCEACIPLATSITKWNMRRGAGTYSYHNNIQRPLTGYWIYSVARPYMCLQALNFGGDALRYWNWDHTQDPKPAGSARLPSLGHPVVQLPAKPAGTPEDWELFTVQAANPANQTVVIFNTAYSPRLTDLGSFNGNPPCYINLIGNNFLCNATKANAVVFQVVFG